MYELIDNYFNKIIETAEFKRLIELKNIIKNKYSLLIVGFKTNEANYEDAKRYKEHMDDFNLLRNKLVESKYKFYNQVFHGFPFIIDEYSSAEVRAEATKQKQINPKVKIWEIKPILIRKHVQSKENNN